MAVVDVACLRVCAFFSPRVLVIHRAESRAIATYATHEQGRWGLVATYATHAQEGGGAGKQKAWGKRGQGGPRVPVLHSVPVLRSVPVLHSETAEQGVPGPPQLLIGDAPRGVQLI